MRLLSGAFLLAWLLGALAFTLRPAHPLPGQVVSDNAIPFVTIRIYLDNLDSAFWVSQAAGNLLLLLPLGLFGPIFLPWLARWWRVLLAAAAFSGAIEIGQLFVRDRSADVDDVMLNAAGALLGYWLLRVVRLLPGSRPEAGVD